MSKNGGYNGAERLNPGTHCPSLALLPSDLLDSEAPKSAVFARQTGGVCIFPTLCEVPVNVTVLESALLAREIPAQNG